MLAMPTGFEGQLACRSSFWRQRPSGVIPATLAQRLLCCSDCP